MYGTSVTVSQRTMSYWTSSSFKGVVEPNKIIGQGLNPLNKQAGSLLTIRDVGLGEQRGLSIQCPHVKTVHKNTIMNSCGCGYGPIENAYVQSPEFSF